MHLKIASWNIDGLYSNISGVRMCKFSDPAVKQILNLHDIICLVETHCNIENYPYLEGYKLVLHNRKKSKRAKRASGGIIIAMKNHISKGVTVKCNNNSEIIWIKLNRKYFGLEKDIFMATVYISPANSSFTSKRDDLFELLEKDIARFSKWGFCILCGDLNSRTSIDNDFVSHDNLKYVNCNLPDYVEDNFMFRNNMDNHPVCNYGARVLELCKTT